MKTLYELLAGKLREIAADEATVAAGEHLHTTHLAKERLPGTRREAAALETDIELGEAACNNLTHALSNAGTINTGGRELSLAITHAEDALHRLRRHVGEKWQG